MSDIFFPRGDYHNLIVYKKSITIFDGTFIFCERFLKQNDRTVGQMVQAARSGKQNLVEGLQNGATNKKFEFSLLDNARGSLIELCEDYEDYLRTRKLPIWTQENPKSLKIREESRKGDLFEGWCMETFKDADAESFCNIMVVIIRQTTYLLDRLLSKFEDAFKDSGGFTERLYHARTSSRSQQPNKPVPQKAAAQSTTLEKAVDMTLDSLRVLYTEAKALDPSNTKEALLAQIKAIGTTLKTARK